MPIDNLEEGFALHLTLGSAPVPDEVYVRLPATCRRVFIRDFNRLSANPLRLQSSSGECFVDEVAQVNGRIPCADYRAISLDDDDFPRRIASNARQEILLRVLHAEDRASYMPLGQEIGAGIRRDPAEAEDFRGNLTSPS